MNSILQNYNNHKNNLYDNKQFQGNPLINNNPNFRNIIGKNNQGQVTVDEKKRSDSIYQHMNRLKNLQEIKKFQKYSDLGKYVDNDKLRESVIKPIKIEKLDKNELNEEYNKRNNSSDNQLTNYWKSRNNQPYKNLLIYENYNKPFNKREDLIIHKVTEADKIGLMQEFKDLKSILEKHDSDLIVIYSSSKEAEHLAKFKYNNVYQFRRKYDPSDFKKLKQDQIKYYKNEQKKIELDKKKTEDLIEAALQNNIINEKEVAELNKKNNFSDLHEELKKEFGAEYEELINDALDNSEFNKKKSSTVTDKSTKIKPKITIKSKPIADTSSRSSQDIIDKYRSRQKRL